MFVILKKVFGNVRETQNFSYKRIFELYFFGSNSSEIQFDLKII